MLVAYLFGSLMRLRRSQKSIEFLPNSNSQVSNACYSFMNSPRYFAMAAAMFMNSNSLPVALMQSIIVTSYDLLKWEEDDTQNAMIGRALSYLVLYSSMGMVVSYVCGLRVSVLESECCLSFDGVMASNFCPKPTRMILFLIEGNHQNRQAFLIHRPKTFRTKPSMEPINQLFTTNPRLMSQG